MRIDKCPHSQYCGDRSGDNAKDKQVWYCPRRHYCPYEKCEKPSPKPKAIPQPEPVEDTAAAKQKQKAERFKLVKQAEEEGLTRWQTINKLDISYYTIKSLEKTFGYKFNFAPKEEIDWSKYDDKIIELKTSGKKITAVEIGKLVGLKHSAVNNRWAKLKKELKQAKAERA